MWRHLGKVAVACDSGSDTRRCGNGATKAAKPTRRPPHPELEPDAVNKVMKLNARNNICQVEGLVYDGAASIGAGAPLAASFRCLPSTVEPVGRRDELFV